jgi:hypothetical protein
VTASKLKKPSTLKEFQPAATMVANEAQAREAAQVAMATITSERQAREAAQVVKTSPIGDKIKTESQAREVAKVPAEKEEAQNTGAMGHGPGRGKKGTIQRESPFLNTPTLNDRPRNNRPMP